MRLLRYGATGQRSRACSTATARSATFSANSVTATGPRCPRRVWRGSPPSTRPGSPSSRGMPRLGILVAGNRQGRGDRTELFAHAAEAGMAIPREPMVFLKATTCLSEPYDDIVRPREATEIDWEVELGIVIGSQGRRDRHRARCHGWRLLRRRRVGARVSARTRGPVEHLRYFRWSGNLLTPMSLRSRIEQLRWCGSGSAIGGEPRRSGRVGRVAVDVLDTGLIGK